MKGKTLLIALTVYLLLAHVGGVHATPPAARITDTLLIDQTLLGFAIPSFQDFLSFIIKFFFVLAGILALFYMLWGAISWVTSGGDKDAVGKARDKITAALIGVMLIVATLAVIAGVEQIVFKGRICFGLTCPLKLPTLLKCPDGSDPSVNNCGADSGTSSPADVLASGGSDGDTETADATTDEGSAVDGADADTTEPVRVDGMSAEAGLDGANVSVVAQPVLPATGM